MYVKRDEIMSKNGAENLVNMMWKVEKLFREQQYTSDYKNEFWSNPQNTPTFNKVFKLLGISHKNEWLRGVHNLFRRINKYNYIQIQVTLDERVTYFEKYSFEYENKKYQLVYDSTSCGDFGSRYTISIYDQDDKTIYDYNVDRVDNREDWLYFSNSFDEKFFNSLINSELKNYIDFHSFEEMEIFLEEQYQN